MDYRGRATALQPLVRAHADANEAERRLVPEIAAAFSEAGLYRVAAPQDCFGSERPPLEQIEIIEAIAQADGAAAWNLMIGIESFGLISVGFDQCRELIEDPNVILASSTAAVGSARPVEAGYQISGRWQFCSGVHNAGLFCATVQVEHDAHEPGGGRSPNRYAILTPDQYSILDTWHTGGLRGSGSHDVEVVDAVIPTHRLIPPLGEVRHPSSLLRFPLGARLAYNKVAVAWGLTRAALDAFVELAEGKHPRFSSRSLRERPRAHRAIAEAEARFRGGRAWVCELLDEMWQRVVAKEKVTSKERAMFQIACSDAVVGCVAAVDQVAAAAGTSANQQGHPLERIQRDIRVVGQHISVAPHNIEDAGRMLLGLPGQEMMLAGIPASNRPDQTK